MKLLVLTQTVDRSDSRLGFFVSWIEALAARTPHIEVICLGKGDYTPPPNVAVHSLGKETIPPGQRARFMYVRRFFSYIWKLRDGYDAVFVHMNEEYVLLGGLLWKLMGKRVYLWRNHYEGGWRTTLASYLCDKVFYTSKHSYTARYANAVQMPVGVDVESAHLDINVGRLPRSILFLARLDRAKRPDLLLRALGILAAQGTEFIATIAGGPTDANSSYLEELQALAHDLGIAERVSFPGAIPNTETFRYYRSHEIFVNCSRSGMLDKTIFKAIACGCLIAVSSDDMAEIVDPIHIYRDNDAEDLARILATLLALPDEKKKASAEALAHILTAHSLPVLADRIVAELSA